MKRFYFAIAFALTISAPSFAADGVRGRTIKSNYRWQTCEISSGRCTSRGAEINVYIAASGKVFDFTTSATGNESRLGQTVNGVMFGASGNVFYARAPNVRVNFTINSGSCTVSAVSFKPTYSAQILSQTCTVVEGPSPK